MVALMRIRRFYLISDPVPHIATALFVSGEGIFRGFTRVAQAQNLIFWKKVGKRIRTLYMCFATPLHIDDKTVSLLGVFQIQA